MASRQEPHFPSFWQLQLMGWGCFYLLILAVLLPYLRQEGALDLFVGNTVFFAALFVASCLLRPVCRSLTRRSLSWLGLEARALAWSALLGVAVAIGPDSAIKGFRNVDWGEWLLDSLQCLVVLTLWCNLYFGIKERQKSALERDRLLRAEAEAREARLRALRYQLNPHFLFNSLNAVSTLVLDGDAPAATRMLAQIGDLLRTTLNRDCEAEVPLSREIAFARQYLAIEQTRLGDRLHIDVAIADETLDAVVPDMLLQPLVENAVQHGIATLVAGGVIAIHSSVQDSRLRIVVRNSVAVGVARMIHTNGNGIGVANTAERLKVLYGPDHKFALNWPEAEVCEVVVELPFRRGRNGEPQCVR